MNKIFKHILKGSLFTICTLVGLGIGAIIASWGGSVMRESPNDNPLIGALQVIKLLSVFAGLTICFMIPWGLYDLFYHKKSGS